MMKKKKKNWIVSLRYKKWLWVIVVENCFIFQIYATVFSFVSFVKLLTVLAGFKGTWIVEKFPYQTHRELSCHLIKCNQEHWFSLSLKFYFVEFFKVR